MDGVRGVVKTPGSRRTLAFARSVFWTAGGWLLLRDSSIPRKMIRCIVGLYELDKSLDRFVSPLPDSPGNNDRHIKLAYPFPPRRLVFVHEDFCNDEPYRCVYVESKPFRTNGVKR